MGSKKKARLGKGLNALLGDVKQTVNEIPATENADNGLFRQIPIEQLSPGEFQPRQHIDKESLEELAMSIRRQGVVQPILVRRDAPDRFEIIAGERRWRAAQLAGLKQLPAVVRRISDQTAMAVGLIENIQREDLNPIEEARGLRRLLDEFELTHQEISETIGRSRTGVSNLLRLLSLNASVSHLLEQNELDMGHARALLSLPDEKQPEVARRVVNQGLSVRATEQLVKRFLKGNDKKSKPRVDADIRPLEQKLSEKLGAQVSIRHGGKKGKLIIEYNSLDELDGIIAKIK